MRFADVPIVGVECQYCAIDDDSAIYASLYSGQQWAVGRQLLYRLLYSKHRALFIAPVVKQADAVLFVLCRPQLVFRWGSETRIEKETAVKSTAVTITSGNIAERGST